MLENLINNVQSKIKLSSDEIELFKACWTQRKLARNEFLFKNGEVCNYDSYVIKGSLKAYYIHPDTGKEVILFFAIDNWWATDLESFANRTGSIYDIQAIEDSLLVQIHHRSFEDLLYKVPKLERYFRLILQSYTSSIQRRIITANSLSAEKRYREFAIKYPAIIQKVPQYLIASYLGISAEFLSRIRSGSI